MREPNIICRADFEYEIINNVVVVFDLDTGCSVTNDVNNVLAKIKLTVPDLGKMKVIYRDSQGIFDEIKIDASGSFIGFSSINENTVTSALKKLAINTLH